MTGKRVGNGNPSPARLVQIVPLMNTEPIPDQNPPFIKIAPPPVEKAKGCLYSFHLFRWLFAGFVVFVLVGLGLPTTGGVQVKGMQTKSLAQAKQISMALKMFADDHGGNYPRLDIPTQMTTRPTDSNAAFACLFPEYLESENIFANRLSVYQTALPDNKIDRLYTGKPKETLQPGENVYGYVMGLTAEDDPNTPLVVDGTDGTGHYNRDPKKRGGVWKGERAIVIRLDTSGAVETLAGPDDARFVPKEKPDVGSIFDFSHTGKDLRLLDPAVGPRRR